MVPLLIRDYGLTWEYTISLSTNMASSYQRIWAHLFIEYGLTSSENMASPHLSIWPRLIWEYDLTSYYQRILSHLIIEYGLTLSEKMESNHQRIWPHLREYGLTSSKHIASPHLSIENIASSYHRKFFHIRVWCLFLSEIMATPENIPFHYQRIWPHLIREFGLTYS
jgi:hypothetical protein